MDENTKVNLKYGQLADMVNRIEQIPPLTGTGAPTTSTPAWYIGQRYIDTQSNNEYYCVEIPSSGVVGYVWQPVDTSTSYTGGDGINIDAQNVISATNTGKARVLTADDYNWPTNNPDRVALWLLPSGIYTNESSEVSVMAYLGNYGALSANSSAIVCGKIGESRLILIDERGNGRLRTCSVNSAGAEINTNNTGTILSTSMVYDVLDSTLPYFPLSANQGRILKSQIGDLTALDTTVQTDLVSAINEVASAGGVTELTTDDYDYPTNNPDGVALWNKPAGVYVSDNGVKKYSSVTASSSTADIYIVGEPNSTSGVLSIVRHWAAGSAAGAVWYSVNSTNGSNLANRSLLEVTQDTGTSASLVMSQNAVTSMVYADPSTKQKVRIGDNSGANGLGSVAIGASAVANGERTVAIGTNSTVLTSYKGSVALGSYSKPTSSGQIDISVQGVSSIVQDYSYNNSGYRLLSGLYDGQSDHDAVTVGQLNTAIAGVTGAEEITSEDWSALWQ